MKLSSSNIAYVARKEMFKKHVMTNCFADLVMQGVKEQHLGGGSVSERASWQSNGDKIKDLLELSDAPNDVVVSFEYRLSLSSKRIDCVLYGKSDDGKDNVIHIELKQWSNESVTEMYNPGDGVFKVQAFTGGNTRPVPHPSQQVKGCQTHLKNFMPIFSDNTTYLKGLAYCYNYNSSRKPNDLYAPQYSSLINEYRLFSGNQVEDLAKLLSFMLKKGEGFSIFNRVKDCEPKQCKSLIDSVANMFKGITEFALQDDQITASNTIFAKVRKAQKEQGKTVIIVKGGPGTGKTVIALDILARYAQEADRPSMFFTTRSKALRETLKIKLSNIKLPGKDKTDASNLVLNISQLKPYYFKESQIDLLMVDEAHRVQNSANGMTDKKETQTYLSQTMALIYCAKVVVFFIDDYQGIKTEEIGYSEDIIKTAKNYRNLIYDYKNTDFYKKYLSSVKKLPEAEAELKQLMVTSTSSALIKKQQKKVNDLKGDLVKSIAWSGQVKSTLDTDIDIV